MENSEELQKILKVVETQRETLFPLSKGFIETAKLTEQLMETLNKIHEVQKDPTSTPNQKMGAVHFYLYQHTNWVRAMHSLAAMIGTMMKMPDTKNMTMQ